jgi:hypothetical protein
VSGSQLDVLVQSRLLLGAGAAAVLKSVLRERKEKQFLLLLFFYMLSSVHAFQCFSSWQTVFIFKVLLASS